MINQTHIVTLCWNCKQHRYFVLKYFTMQQSLVVDLCTYYCFIGVFGVAHKNLVRENEVCKVIGTM